MDIGSMTVWCGHMVTGWVHDLCGHKLGIPLMHVTMTDDMFPMLSQKFHMNNNELL